MQAIVLCGIQASGKSSFYRDHFFYTHVRISLDLLKTRHRERLFLETCFRSRAPFVVDNTNPTMAEREVYISAAREAGYEVLCYYFPTELNVAIARNALREGKEHIPVPGIKNTYYRLQPPVSAEGFDHLYHVMEDPVAGDRRIIEQYMDSGDGSLATSL